MFATHHPQGILPTQPEKYWTWLQTTHIQNDKLISKKMTWNSFSLATVNLVKTNNCLNMMINSIAGISEYPRVTELQSYYGTLRTYAQGPSMFLFPYILLTNKFPATFCQVVRAYLLFRWSRKMRWLREKHRPRFAKNQANPAPSRRNPPARSID